MRFEGNKVRLRTMLPDPHSVDRKLLLREGERTPHIFSSSVEDVRADHRRSDVPVL
jgi:hypothetical protein